MGAKSQSQPEQVPRQYLRQNWLTGLSGTTSNRARTVGQVWCCTDCRGIPCTECAILAELIWTVQSLQCVLLAKSTIPNKAAICNIMDVKYIINLLYMLSLHRCAIYASHIRSGTAGIRHIPRGHDAGTIGSSLSKMIRSICCGLCVRCLSCLLKENGQLVRFLATQWQLPFC